ncbi:MAG: hypothetical protein JWQ48_206 [Conexibacter sp.]|nr:hypothetical protein [Conexibacter sp.]
MARPASGTVHTHVLADGSRAFHLRVRYRDERPRIVLHEIDGCACGCGGGWDEPAARTELGNILARIRVGVWTPPQAPDPLIAGDVDGIPLFRDYAWGWLERRVSGEIGDRPIAQGTRSSYRWRISHLVRFFGHYGLEEIDTDLCRQFKAHKLTEAQELRDAIAAGAELRDLRERRIKPLSLHSVRMLIDTLTAILDEAIEDRLIATNPARSRRMRIKVPKPRRTFLEMDELAALLDAAAEQDRHLPSLLEDRPLGPTTRLVAHMLGQGHRPEQIARRLGIARSTVSWHLRRLDANVGRGYLGCHALCAILGYTGVRIGELCELRIGQVRLQAHLGAYFHIPDAKTPAGVREVQLSPNLADIITDHLQQLRRIGRPTGPDDYLVQSITGGPISRQRASKILGHAAERANEHRVDRGLSALPHTTPHTLRRTYISIALVANNFDVKWVQAQVGHADSQMTMDVYAQLEQRIDRSHGQNFDRLLREATGRHRSAAG